MVPASQSEGAAMATAREIRNAILDDLSSRDETMTTVELSRYEASLVIGMRYEEEDDEPEEEELPLIPQWFWFLP